MLNSNACNHVLVIEARVIAFTSFEYAFAGGGGPANKSTWARSAFRLKVYGSGAHKEAGRWDSRVSP